MGTVYSAFVRKGVQPGTLPPMEAGIWKSEALCPRNRDRKEGITFSDETNPVKFKTKYENGLHEWQQKLAQFLGCVGRSSVVIFRLVSLLKPTKQRVPTPTRA